MEKTNEVLPEGDIPTKPPRTFSKLRITLIILFSLLIIVFLGGSSIFAYQYYYVIQPAKVLMTAYEKTFPLNSFQLELISAQKNDHFELKINYHNDPEELSEILFSLDRVNGNPEEKMSSSIRFDSNDIYSIVVYTPNYKVYEPINQYYPELLPTKAYQLIFPVMLGTHWLHVNIPQVRVLTEELLNLPTVGKESKPQTLEPEEQTDFTSLKQAIIIRNVDRRFVSGGRKFYKIIVGFKKEELLNYINSLKQINTGVDEFLVESTVRLVESVSDWNYDVAEVLIDYQNEEIYKVTLNLSAIPNEVIREVLEDANKRYLYIINLSSVFSKMFVEQPSRTIQFTNFNQSPQVSLPDKDKMVEMETIYRSAEREKLLPLLNILVKKVGF